MHFTGPKGELPKGEDGSYGTHMTLMHAMDPAGDVLIAYKQNGQFLHPDHGFPCRMLIPGWIGGRMVKWLSHIHVSEHHSENWYHYHDNKVRTHARPTPPAAVWRHRAAPEVVQCNICGRTPNVGLHVRSCGGQEI